MELKLKKSNLFFVVGVGQWNKIIFSSERKNNNKKLIFINSKAELSKKLKKHDPLIIFFIHWHWKISKKFLKLYNCIGFHMTKLPYGRGGSPLQNLILRNKKFTYITAYKITEKMDTGPICFQKKIPLNGSAEDIYKRVTQNSISIIKSNFLKKTKLIFKKQNGKTTYFKRRNPKQSEIKNINNIKNLYDFIRMLDAPGYPKAYLDKNKYSFSFFDAKIKNNIIETRVIIKKNV